MGNTGTREVDNKKDTMVLAAKMGEWDKVWKILDNNPHFVNFIPGDRAWGILHQACYWGNEEAIKKILSTPGCDPNLVTKNGLRAIQITKIPSLQDLIASAQSLSFIKTHFVVDQRSFAEVLEADEPKIKEISVYLKKMDMIRVIFILNAHQHLVNVVSPTMGLAPLHQAALLSDVKTATKILNYPFSNPVVRTIKAPQNTHGTGKTAEQLTDSEEVREVITQKKKKLKQEYFQFPSSVDISVSNCMILRYVRSTIEAHRGLLCSEKFNSEQFDLYTKMMENMFLYIHYNNNWEAVKEMVSKELYKWSCELALECNAMNSESSFFKHLISLYIGESLQAYRKLYSEMHFQELNEENIPEFYCYSTLLNAVLFFWQDLESYTSITYREVYLKPDEISKYSIGTEFAWLCINPCTKLKPSVKISENYIFVIDNSLKCRWSPKSTAEISQCQDESVYLYPCGAQFRITKVEKSELTTHVYLKLICPIDASPIRPLFEETNHETDYGASISEKRIELAAKMGDWERVWAILETYPHLVNCIPERRSWGILHHACYWENGSAIGKILSFPWCDPNLVTKDGLQAIEITKKTNLQSLVLVAIQKCINEADVWKINEIDSALEKGDMAQVITLIDTAQHLVNTVSLVIGLAPLHQAALLKDVETVTKILNYPASDPDIKTREAAQNPHGADKTAEQLTDSEEVKAVINWKKQQLKQEYYECPTFVDISDSNILLMRYVCHTIEAHRGIFCSEKFNPEQFEVFPKLIEEMFLYIQFTGPLWKVVKVIISKELYKLSRDTALECNRKNSEDSFYKHLITIYTHSCASSSINSELRNQAMNMKSAPEISSYSALLNAILLVWRDIHSYTGVTYRGMTLEADQFHQYSVGTEFAWLNFVSSTNIKEVAETFLQETASLPSGFIKSLIKKHLNVKWLNKSSHRRVSCIFVIDNSLKCKWSPKSIAEFSKFKNEGEYLYPCGAQFRVIKIVDSETRIHIYLQLICPIDSTPLRSLFEETQVRAELSIQNIEFKLDQFKIDLEDFEIAVEAASLRKNEMMKLSTNSEENVNYEMIEGNKAVKVFSYYCQICNTQCHELCTTQCFHDTDNGKVCGHAISGDQCIVCPGKCHISNHIVKSLPVVELIQQIANRDNPQRYEFVKKDFNDLKIIIISLTSKMQDVNSELKSAYDEMNLKIHEFDTIFRKNFPVGRQEMNAVQSKLIVIAQQYGRLETKFEETLNLSKKNLLI